MGKTEAQGQSQQLIDQLSANPRPKDSIMLIDLRTGSNTTTVQKYTEKEQTPKIPIIQPHTISRNLQDSILGGSKQSAFETIKRRSNIDLAQYGIARSSAGQLSEKKSPSVQNSASRKWV